MPPLQHVTKSNEFPEPSLQHGLDCSCFHSARILNSVACSCPAPHTPGMCDVHQHTRTDTETLPLQLLPYLVREDFVSTAKFWLGHLQNYRSKKYHETESQFDRFKRYCVTRSRVISIFLCLNTVLTNDKNVKPTPLWHKCVRLFKNY